jgi:hypothetical protein
MDYPEMQITYDGNNSLKENVMQQLTRSELEIIRDLLEEASESFSRHGCNDFHLSYTLDNIDIVHEAYDCDSQYIMEGASASTGIDLHDHVLMSHFYRRIRDMLTAEL